MEFFKNKKKSVVAFIDRFLQEKSQEFAEVNPWGEDVFARLIPFVQSGKMIRSGLVCLGYEACRGKASPAIHPAAAAVEFIQTALLIHDDIIDKSDVRRGRESVHARWGPNITVLLGDYLYIKSIGLSLQSPHRQIIGILTETSSRMIEGELNEYYLSGQLDIAENVGVGIGATVGKFYGLNRAMKAGVGSACLEGPYGRVGALVVVNSFGDVVDYDTGEPLAGLRDESGKRLISTAQEMKTREIKKG